MGLQRGCRAQKAGPRGEEEDKAKWKVDQSCIATEHISKAGEEENFALQALRCINGNKQHIREDESCPGRYDPSLRDCSV